jgi:hypothetical protein
MVDLHLIRLDLCMAGRRQLKADFCPLVVVTGQRIVNGKAVGFGRDCPAMDAPEALLVSIV